MKRLVHGKRMLFLLVLFLLTSSFITWGQVTTDKFDVYDDSFGTTIDDRAKVEIDWIVITNDYGNKELTITGVRLKVLKGFELSENYLRGSILGSGRSYDLSNFSLLEDKGGWLTYAYASNLLYQFKEVYSCDWKTGAVSRRDYFFYDKGIRIAPVKDKETLFNICDYYVPGSVSLWDDGIIFSENIKIPLPIRFVGDGSAIAIHQEERSEGISFKAQEINIDGGDISFIGKNDQYTNCNVSPVNLLSGSLRLCNIRLSQLIMESGNLTLEGEYTSLAQASVSGGSIYYKDEDERSAGSPYIGNSYDDFDTNKLTLSGNVSIIGERKKSLAYNVLVKKGTIDIQNNVTDTSCGTEKANSFALDSIVIDDSYLAFKNTDQGYGRFKGITILGTSFVEMNNVSFGSHIKDTEPLIRLKGGTLSIEDSYFDGYYSIEQESGLLQIRSSHISSNYSVFSNNSVLLMKGTDAKTEIFSGYFGDRIEVESGTLDIKDGVISGAISMKGGSLNVAGGEISQYIEVWNDSDISLSGGDFRRIIFDEQVTIPESSSLLAEGYEFGEKYINTVYPLGKKLTAKKGGLQVNGEVWISGMVYEFGTVTKESPMRETVAYKAAKIADVGPDGKDVRVDGLTFEILTPEGLAWLAVKTNDGTTARLENGSEYLPNWPHEAYNKTKTFVLKNDLDMNGYGEDWPSIMVRHNILDGQGHRVYNLDMTGATPSFVDNVFETGIVANLVIEGDLILSGSNHIGGICRSNAGRIINCAFMGTISSVIYTSAIAGLVGSNRETGRIENCYVNPCGGLIKGIRPASITAADRGYYHCQYEWYEVAKLVASNQGSVENCYFAGELDFDNQAKYDLVDVKIHDFVGDWNGDFGTVTNCYDKSEVSLQTLNKNVQDHQQEKDYPWVTWAVDPNKQCGMPYLVFDGAVPPSKPRIIITGDEPYDPEAHFKANVIVKSGAIYTIDEMEAYIASLTVEDGGQVRLRKPLNVTDSVAVRRYIETDKWTTLCIPEIMMMENNLWDFSLEPEQRPIWSKIGYLDEKTQQWQDYGADNIIPNRAHLYVARFTSQMGLFHTIDINAPFTLKAANTLEAPVNVPDGDWFHFVANPYWENLPIEGRAYVLNEAGTSFDLRENPVIPPFHCYMVASEKVMSEVSSLRLAGIPTSADKVEESGLRVWTESGTLCFETSEAKAVSVYSISGVPQARYERSVGVKRVALPKGVYLLVCEGQAVKVVL
ncbi:hypothetical protein [Parabacteroides sp.]